MDMIKHPITSVEEEIPTKAEAKQGLTAVYHSSLNGIQMAFALIMALAWYSLIKNFMQSMLPGGKTLLSMLIYAIIMTIIFVAVSYVISQKLGVPAGNQIMYAVTP